MTSSVILADNIDHDMNENWNKSNVQSPISEFRSARMSVPSINYPDKYLNASDTDSASQSPSSEDLNSCLPPMPTMPTIEDFGTGKQKL